jgi:hypothetical protein
MDPTFYRILWILAFVAFMATVYIALHVLVARLIRNPQSQVLGFFALVTSPLTSPVRRLLPRGTSERRVRLATLGICAAAWLLLRLVLNLNPPVVE